MAKTTRNLFAYVASICLVWSLLLLVLLAPAQAQGVEDSAQDQYEEEPFEGYVPPGECDLRLGGCPTVTDTGCYLYPNGDEICPTTEDLAGDAANDSQTATGALNEETTPSQPEPVEEPVPEAEPVPPPEPFSPAAEPEASPVPVDPTPSEPAPEEPEPSVSDPIAPASESSEKENPEPDANPEQDQDAPVEDKAVVDEPEDGDKKPMEKTEEQKANKQGEVTREETRGSTNGTRIDSASSVDEPENEGLAGMILMGGGFALVLGLGVAGHIFTRFR